MSRRKRNERNAYKLYNENTTLGWTVLRRISFEDGEKQVNLRLARHVFDEHGRHIGYQLYRSALQPQAVTMSATPSSAAFSRAEADAIACSKWRGHRSRTVNLTEEQRMKRMHPVTKKILPAEDFTERALQKMQVYPAVH